MNEVIIYLLKVMAIHGLLYLVYRLVFRNTARHSVNRLFLLGSLLLAFVVPFIELPSPVQPELNEHQSGLIVWLSEPTSGLEEFELIPVQEEASDFSYWSLLPWFYGLVTLVLIVRSVIYLSMLSRLKKHSEYIRKRWFKLFKTSHERPFSFFSNVFMPKTLFGSDAFRQILAHECVHVRQFHSVDRLLLDFVVSLFWFNPFIYLYRNALIEIHEYQADEAVVRRFNDPIGYQEILFSQLQSAQYSGLVSHFNFSMIKKRIVMMNKQRKMSGWVYALTLPVTLMVVFAFSSKEAMEPINDVGNEIAELIKPEPSFGLFPIWDQAEPKSKTQFQNVSRNVPSISPIDESDLNRLASGFGMRTHPISKVKKFHKGADFSCKSGTNVMATGDGVVASIENDPEGYGKMITIDHQNGFVTRYAQLSEFKVEVGAAVNRGEVVALSGNSGMSTAPHLHYEVINNDEHVDPVRYITDYTLRRTAKKQDGNEPSILPFKSAENIRMTSGFGMRIHPVEKVEKRHFGMDFSCPLGTEVIATADGEVTETKTYKEGTAYGKLLVIDHGGGYVTRYAQLSAFKAEAGDKVKKGDVVALSGNSGASTAPHLHYEVRKDGKFVNPMHYIHDYNFKVNSNTKGSIEVDPEEGKRINEDDKKQLEELKAMETIRQIEKAQMEQKEIEKLYALEKSEREMMQVLRAKELQERAEIEQVEASEQQLRAEKVMMEAKRAQEIAAQERHEIQLKKNAEETKRLVEELRYVDAQHRRVYEEIVSRKMIYIVDGAKMDKDEVLKIDMDEISTITVDGRDDAIEKYGDNSNDGVVFITTKGKKSKSKNKSKNKKKDKQGAFRVIIDPGHGGKDPGTKSQMGLIEKDIVLDVAKLVEESLGEKTDIEIIFTRDDDTYIDLLKRSEASQNADLLVSIHTSTNEDDPLKATTIYLDPDGLYYDQSLAISRLFEKEFNAINRQGKVGLSNLYLMRSTDCPALLVNIGSLSSRDDVDYMNSTKGKKELAYSIAHAIEESSKLNF